MSHRRRIHALAPGLALLMAGCLGNSGGPSIPSASEARQARVATAERPDPPPQARKKSNFRRREMKSPTAPRVRSPVGEADPR